MKNSKKPQGDRSLTVQTLPDYVPGWGNTTHLKIRRRNGEDGITWDELMAAKNEGFPDEIAIEIYPREEDLVNETNTRHLWIVPAGVVVPNLKR